MSVAPKLVIVSSDGTLNIDVENGVQSPDEWQPLPGAMAAVARLNQAGWRVVVTTNQPGLGRGLFGVDTLHAIHSRMHACVGEAGGRIEAVFFCPHSPAENCRCRKPSPGLAQCVAQRYGIASLKGVPAVGDSLEDIQAAIAAGCAPHLVLSGIAGSQAGPDGQLPADWPGGVAVHRDLAAFVQALLAQEGMASSSSTSSGALPA